MRWDFYKWNYVLGLILAIWATIIGPEILILGKRGVLKKEKQRKINLPNTYPLKLKKHKIVEKIDEEIFLKSFKRQSNKELLGCLRSHYPNMVSLPLVAKLTKKGKLISIESPLNRDELPGCLLEIIKKMDFSQLTIQFKSSYIEISWGLGW